MSKGTVDKPQLTVDVEGQGQVPAVATSLNCEPMVLMRALGRELGMDPNGNAMGNYIIRGGTKAIVLNKYVEEFRRKGGLCVH